MHVLSLEGHSISFYVHPTNDIVKYNFSTPYSVYVRARAYFLCYWANFQAYTKLASLLATLITNFAFVFKMVQAIKLELVIIHKLAKERSCKMLYSLRAYRRLYYACISLQYLIIFPLFLLFSLNFMVGLFTFPIMWSG